MRKNWILERTPKTQVKLINSQEKPATTKKKRGSHFIMQMDEKAGWKLIKKYNWKYLKKKTANIYINTWIMVEERRKKLETGEIR